jgi:hypothetical protein
MLPLRSSLMCSFDRCDHHGCLFDCFRTLYHFLTCYTLITPSPYTSINWSYMSMGENVSPIKTELKNFAGTKLMCNVIIAHQLVSRISSDWLILRHLLHVTRSTSVAYYWEIIVFFNIKVTGWGTLLSDLEWSVLNWPITDFVLLRYWYFPGCLVKTFSQNNGVSRLFVLGLTLVFRFWRFEEPERKEHDTPETWVRKVLQRGGILKG